jgi:hypothetical protein
MLGVMVGVHRKVMVGVAKYTEYQWGSIVGVAKSTFSAFVLHGAQTLLGLILALFTATGVCEQDMV